MDLKADCPNCEGRRNCEAIGEESVVEHSGPVFYSTTYRLLKCCGCDTVFFQTVGYFSEDSWGYEGADGIYVDETPYEVKYFPDFGGRKPPQSLTFTEGRNTHLSEILEEVYSSFNVQNLQLFCVGLRIAFDICAQELGIDGSLSFKEKIEELTKTNLLDSSDVENIDLLVEVGNAAAHRDWKPNITESSELLTVFERFINNLELAHRLSELKDKVPARPKKNVE